MTGSAPAYRRVRRHRGRRAMVAVVALLVVLVVVDRVSLLVAERAAAVTMQRSQQLSSTPSVSVAGFPFLTQIAAADLHRITVKATGVRAGDGDRALRVASVTVVLRGVHIARNLSSVRADSATASGRISYADLSTVLGFGVAYAGTSDGVGRVRATVAVTVAGVRISGSLTAGIAVSSNSLSFDDITASAAAGSLSSSALPLLRGSFGAPLSLAHLPFGVRVDALQVQPGGVLVDLSGADLVYTR